MFVRINWSLLIVSLLAYKLTACNHFLHNLHHLFLKQPYNFTILKLLTYHIAPVQILLDKISQQLHNFLAKFKQTKLHIIMILFVTHRGYHYLSLHPQLAVALLTTSYHLLSDYAVYSEGESYLWLKEAETEMG